MLNQKEYNLMQAIDLKRNIYFTFAGIKLKTKGIILKAYRLKQPIWEYNRLMKRTNVIA